MNLVKATLIPWDEGVPEIHFMFNPTELSFECAVEAKESQGARTEEKGNPKTNFSHVKADKVTISKIVFDTYEDQNDKNNNVVTRYIEPFRAAVEFVSSERQSSQNPKITFKPFLNLPVKKGASKESKDQRTPIYRFVWGKQIYLRRCFVEKLTYKLTMFLPDGTPVRAIIDSLTLKQADEPQPSEDLAKPIVDRANETIANKLKKK